VEFHDLKDKVMSVIPGRKDNVGDAITYDFGGMSCEHIGEAILEALPSLVMVEVSEDGECTAIVTREKKEIHERPYLVTLCGSTKFRKEFEMAAYLLEKLGISVLSVGGFMHAHKLEVKEELKMAYDKLHISKISLSDGILVLNRGGYIGRSTSREIAFARDVNKDIFMLEGHTFLHDGKPIGANVLSIHPDAEKYRDYWTGEVQLPFIVRDSAIEFARAMEEKLIMNDQKGGWKNRPVHPDLFDRLTLEMSELECALTTPEDDASIMREAADVGNFAMMIFDNVMKGRHIDGTN